MRRFNKVSKHFITIIFSLLLILCFAFAHLHAQEIIYKGSTLWTRINTAAIDGNYAYCGFENGLMILDISDKTSPELVSQLFLGAQGTYGVAISDHYAYLGVHHRGLIVVDIIDPANPQIIRELSSLQQASKICLMNSYAYVIDQTLGLVILNITNPRNPVIDNTLDNDIEDLFVEGQYAFMAYGRNSFDIYSIANPADPQYISTFTSPSNTLHITDVTGNSNYIYLCSNEGFSIIDITIKANPSFAGHYATDIGNQTATVYGHYAYISSMLNSGGMHVVDISNPENPVQIQLFDSGKVAYTSLILDGHLYLFYGRAGLEIYNCADPAALQFVGKYETAQYSVNFALSGDYAYVANTEGGLYIVDITDSYNPTVVGHYETFGSACDIVVRDSYAYVADAYSGLIILDITDPANPLLVSQFPMPEWPISLKLVNGIAYFASRYAGLQIIDVSDPADPIFLGSYPATDVFDVFIDNGLAYVVDQINGILILDISDPTNPFYKGNYIHEFINPHYYRKVYIKDGYAYICTYSSNGEFIIADISDPHNPETAGLYNHEGFSGWSFAIDMTDEYAYVGAGEFGAVIYDVSDPADIKLVTEYELSGSSERGIHVRGDDIYFCYNGGFIIAELADFAPCSYTPGDINGDGHLIGSDVTYGVNYFRGGTPPPDSCWNNVTSEWQYTAADGNGDCHFIGSDITYLVNYFRGVNPLPQYCIQTPPADAE